MRYLILSVLCLVGCGTDQEASSRPKFLSIDEKVVSYVADFEAESIAHGKPVVVDHLIVKFDNIPQTKEDKITLAYCKQVLYKTGVIPTIVLDSGEWRTATKTRKRVLMFHELAHCVLDRDHEDRYASIMNAMILSDKTFNSNPYLYIDELFNPEKYRPKKKQKPIIKKGFEP
jgi:hypothetical protein